MRRINRGLWGREATVVKLVTRFRWEWASRSRYRETFPRDLIRQVTSAQLLSRVIRTDDGAPRVMKRKRRKDRCGAK